MKISEAAVGNYRSIGRQTQFSLSHLTTLVGPNNEGKSNLLRALALGLRVIEAWGTLPEHITQKGEISGPTLALIYDSFRARRQPDKHRDVNYEWTSDYPLAKQSARSPQPTVIRITFTLSQDEIADFKSQTGLSNNGSLPLELKFSRTRTSLQIVKPGKGAAGYTSKAAEIARFVSERIDYVLVPAVRAMDQTLELLNDVARLRLSELAKTNEYQTALRTVDELRNAAVASIEEDIQSSIATYLANVESVELARRDVRFAETIRGVTINDGSPTPLSQKGDGVKSLFALALIQHLAQQRIGEKDANLVLLVDEPEAHLHSRAVHDLLALFTKIAREQQVVLASHNPIFVNRETVSANVIVKENTASAARSVRDVREVLGIALQDNLDSAEVVILTEGWTDAQIIPSALQHVRESASKEFTSGRVVFKAATGTGNLAKFIQRERSTACRILVVLDGDAAGDRRANELHESGILDRRNIFLLRDAGRDESEIEDLLRPEVYLEALKLKFGRTFKESFFKDPRKKWAANFVKAATTIGLSTPESELVRDAKVTTKEAVVVHPAQPFKESSMPVLEALAEAIWP
ncbi:putative ATP-dependent endonuclease of OLD family [Leucobacter luti]|uniref:Putative ATP-dependent endonuclease of OLD family n=1 Tax=Leucobacter luti TaxID=340320 RepID=A0A4R6RUV4_9MICO|nr:AAA family ATPase [Leucobacter luti]TDP90751.1 putative ATP-dependent endonuclease of OLD family [Leucobacter luti]